MKLTSVLAVGGIDPSGGAGLSQDVATLGALKVRCGTVVTCLTVQDDAKVHRVEPVAPDLFSGQLDAAVRVLGRSLKAIKTGLLVDGHQASAVAELARERNLPLVVDPIMRAGTGDSFTDQARETLDHVIADAALIVPNIDEACALTGLDLAGSDEELLQLARALSSASRTAAVSGGHAPDASDSVSLAISHGTRETIARARRRSDVSTHGTGCALAAAAAGWLACGAPAFDAAVHAHTFVSRSIALARGTGGTRICPEPWLGAD